MTIYPKVLYLPKHICGTTLNSLPINSISGSPQGQFISTILSLDYGPHCLVSSLNLELCYCLSHSCSFFILYWMLWKVWCRDSRLSLSEKCYFGEDSNCTSYDGRQLKTLPSPFSFLAICSLPGPEESL